jgi:hypothetical protein
MVGNRVPNASEAERVELESVLKSQVLLRSPSVLKIAEYIARTYLDGDAGEIKEYNIAVDALGKPVEFDPKRDSIVRVEVHRLRKKIDTFYKTEGADHKLRVVIDPGKYVPRFEAVTLPVAEQVGVEIPAAIVVVDKAMEVPLAIEPVGKRGKFSWWTWLAPVAAGLAAIAWSRMPPRVVSVAPEPLFLLAGTPPALVAVADAGFILHGDQWFTGGTPVYPAPHLPIAPATVRTGQRTGNFEYAIPLADVPWELRLYFGLRSGPADKPAPIARGFDVLANGVKLMNGQDPDVGETQGEQSVVRVFRDIRPGPDHLLHLTFVNGRERAYVGGIGLSPGQAGSLLPIRLLSKTAPWTDVQGHTWNPDGEFVKGGTLKLCQKLDAGGVDMNVMTGERYGRFTYKIPVSKGTYRLKLYLAESWFGPDRPGGGGLGSRRFDVYAERQSLLQDFDVFREAGHKPLVKEFHGLKTDADGYINLQFISRTNHAEVNALELVEERGYFR